MKTYITVNMSNENISELETSPRLHDEIADDGNELQQISRYEDTNQQVSVPAIVESLRNQVAIGNLASTPGTINVSLNVGKMYF